MLLAIQRIHLFAISVLFRKWSRCSKIYSTRTVALISGGTQWHRPRIPRVFQRCGAAHLNSFENWKQVGRQCYAHFRKFIPHFWTTSCSLNTSSTWRHNKLDFHKYKKQEDRGRERYRKSMTIIKERISPTSRSEQAQTHHTPEWAVKVTWDSESSEEG